MTRLGERARILGISVGVGALLLGLLAVVLEPETRAHMLLLGWGFPLSIQVLEHLLFFVGVGELVMRWRSARYELAFMQRGYLPEDEETVLQFEDLGPIRKQVKDRYDGERGFLAQLMDICILQFQASRSVDQTVSVLNSTLELMSHRLELRFSAARYIVWAIPTVGFIGTVVGIASTLTLMDSSTPDLTALTGTLSVAFDTTILALVQSAVLVLGLHLAQAGEERSLNLAGAYTLRNLVNRLYAGRS